MIVAGALYLSHLTQTVVLVALHVTSSPADQLRAAVAIEILDYIISGHTLSVSHTPLSPPSANLVLQSSEPLAQLTEDIHRVRGHLLFITYGVPNQPCLVHLSLSLLVCVCVGQGDELTGLVSDRLCPSLLPSLLPALTEAGWNSTHVLLAANEWRYSWKTDS